MKPVCFVRLSLKSDFDLCLSVSFFLCLISDDYS